MPHYLSDAELKRTAPAEIAAFRGPIPTRSSRTANTTRCPRRRSNAASRPGVGAAGDLAPKHGLSRRKFLASSAGMAAAFLAMNDVFAPSSR